jgi:membrane-associated protein
MTEPNSLQTIIQNLGIWGHPVIWAILFAESGLLIGFFLPGDTLLISAGIMASPKVGVLNLGILLVGSVIAAIAGDNVGYLTGNRFGRKLFTRESSWFFDPDHLVKAQAFYDKHGKLTIILARFVPVIRTFAPIVAGIGRMNYKIFVTYNIIGGILWTVGMTLLGYFLGKSISDIDKYLIPVMLAAMSVTILPSIWHIIKEQRKFKNK